MSDDKSLIELRQQWRADLSSVLAGELTIELGRRGAWELWRVLGMELDTSAVTHAQSEIENGKP